MDEMILHIRDDGIILLEEQNDGIYKTKYVNPQALLECIQASRYSDLRGASGFLPKEALAISISAQQESRYVVMDCDVSHIDVTYMDTVYEHFPLPRLVFGFVVEKGGRISKVRMGVVADEEKLTGNTAMYHYPFSNVDHFRVCVGNNFLPLIPNLQGLNSIPEYILRLPANDDYYQALNNKLKLSHRDLLEHLQDKDRSYYYSQVLIPMPFITLSNFLNLEG